MTVALYNLVLSKTTKCPYNFSCLEASQNGGEPKCEVDYANGQNVLFLETKESVSCPYRVPFGYCQVCVCPMHFYLHKKSGK